MVEPTVIAQSIRNLAIAVLMLTHIQFAALIIGFFGLGLTMEIAGMLNHRQPNFDRLARGLARTTVLMYSTGAVLAIIFFIVVTLLFPTFWFVIIRINFWPMFLEGFTFLLTILFLFPWYYTWDRLARFKGVHVSLALALWYVAQLQQSMVDVMAGYMLTPSPPADLARVFFNPTAVPLDMHRIVGDMSFAGFVVAGFAAVRALRASDPDRRAFFDWIGGMAIIFGLGFLLLQPVVGVAYLMEIRVHAPGAFSKLMRGDLSWVFNVLGGFFSLLFGLSVYYVISQIRKSGYDVRWLRFLLVVLILSALLLIQPYVIGWSQYDYSFNWVNPIGSMQPWKYIAFGGITIASFLALTDYVIKLGRGIRWGEMDRGGRRAQYVLLGLAVLGSVTMLTMGYVRENSRLPYLINFDGRVDAPEAFPNPGPTPTPGPRSETPPGTVVAEWEAAR